MKPLLGLCRAIDAMNRRLGAGIAWLVLVAVVVSTGNAIIRKVFHTSSNAWLEVQWLLYSVVFLGCAAWTLLSNEHIRIDIVGNLFSKRTRDWIDVVGHALFLVPIAAVIVATSWPFFVASFVQNEQSSNAGGLAVWPAKLIIPTAFALLLAQGVSELIKRIAILRGIIDEAVPADRRD